MTDIPLGCFAIWQVEYPDNRGVQYWWDYDEQTTNALERLRTTSFGSSLRFSLAFPNGRTSEYQADPAIMRVTNQDTQFTRNIRRVLVQIAGFDVDEEPLVLNSLPPLGFTLVPYWQVAFDDYGVELSLP